MNTDRKDMAFRIAGMVGLALLLGLVLWARQPRGSAKPAHDHADPAHHGHAVEGKALDAEHAGTLTPSGQVANGVRVVDYDAFQYGFAPDPLVVRAGDRVRLRVKSPGCLPRRDDPRGGFLNSDSNRGAKGGRVHLADDTRRVSGLLQRFLRPALAFQSWSVGPTRKRQQVQNGGRAT